MAATASLALDLSFDGAKVRVFGTAEKPHWAAEDVCNVLGIANARHAVAEFGPDERGVAFNDTTFGRRELVTVSESGLYRLAFRSNKPEAKKFRDWVLGEVLPSIRKWGCYPPPADAAFRITLKAYTARVAWVFKIRRDIPAGFWCVLLEGADFLINAEHIFGPTDLEMKQYDLLDGSIGRHWASFRLDKPWAGARRGYSYTFPDGDPRGTVTPWCYPMQEIQHFKEWLHATYWNEHFPQYVKTKYGAKAFQRVLPIFAQLGVPMLSHSPKKGRPPAK